MSMQFKSLKITFIGSLVASLAMVNFAGARENLTAETASPGGAVHLSMTYLAEAVSDAGVADLQVQAGQTLTNTLINVANGSTDIGVAPLILPFLLKHGRGPYSKQGKEAGSALVANVRALYPYNFGAHTLFSFQSSGITSFDQLKGKTIFNGPPRGGALINARQVLQIVAGLKDGEGYKGIQVNWGQANKTIADGSADAIMLPATFPSDRVMAALAAGKVNIISTPKDIFEGEAFTRFSRAPGSAPVVIAIKDMGYGEGVTVHSEDEYYRSAVTVGAEIVNKSMSNDLAKAIVAAYIANLDNLRAKTPYAKNIGLAELDPVKSGFCGAMPIKYHPGAVMAWEEAGYTVPDCAKP